jgi:four helix bundle protein
MAAGQQAIVQSSLLEFCLPEWRTLRASGLQLHASHVVPLSRMLRGWAGMQNSRSSSVVEHALAVVALARPLVEAVQRKDRDLASQLRRATSSIALNLSEGFGAAAGNARLRFESALGSLNEAKTAIRVAVAWGYFTNQAAQPTLDELNALGGRIAGLARR